MDSHRQSKSGSRIEGRPYRSFREISARSDRSVGGKAFYLAHLAEAGFPVPDGIVLRSLPAREQDWIALSKWWKSKGSPKVAVRSSAVEEDSREHSFAGQLESYLDIGSEKELREAISRCFASLNGAAARAYRSRFREDGGSGSIGMNVIVQEMVDPLFAGVYFDRDPRASSAGWLVEAVPGLGVSLVSGKSNPIRLKEGKPAQVFLAGWSSDFLEAVVETAKKIGRHASVDFEIDMEWAIDKQGRFWVLQVRPITTKIHSSDPAAIQSEAERLQAGYEAETVWDSSTFAEFTCNPSELTFSIWEEAFSPRGAFNQVVKHLGYAGFGGEERKSVLERVFGQAYVNLSRMQELYFGDSPFRMELKPRPRFALRAEKLTLKRILQLPSLLLRMLTVGWRLQSRREAYLQQAREQLDLQACQAREDNSSRLASPQDEAALRRELGDECQKFSRELLFWPFVLIFVVEATLGALRKILGKSSGESGGGLLIWISLEVQTVTSRMNLEYQQACQDPGRQQEFLERFGHRGPGEMELSAPRWREMGQKAFWKASALAQAKAGNSPDDLLSGIGGIKRLLLQQELKIMKQALELRELWKMEVMRSYARIRELAVQIGERSGFGASIFLL